MESKQNVVLTFSKSLLVCDCRLNEWFLVLSLYVVPFVIAHEVPWAQPTIVQAHTCSTET